MIWRLLVLFFLFGMSIRLSPCCIKINYEMQPVKPVINKHLPSGEEGLIKRLAPYLDSSKLHK